MDFTERELTARLHWLVRLRWAAALGIVGFGLFARHGLGFDIPVLWLVALAAVVAGYNLVFLLVLRRQAQLCGRRAAILAHAQIAADLVALSVLVHLTGGIENPFAAYFVFHMIIASTLLTRLAALAHATLACILFAAVLYLEAQGLIPHRNLHLLATEELYRSLVVWPLYAVWASVLYISVYLASSIASRLRERERELTQLTAELTETARAREEALDQLQEAQRLQLRYMRRVSHELRSPLAAAVMLLNVVAQNAAGRLGEKVTGMLERATGRISQALEMVSDLLTLSQSKDAPLAEEFRPVHIAQVIEMVTDTETERAAHKGIRLVREVAPDTPQISGQKEALTTALVNLVSNAIKYSPEQTQVTISAMAGDDGELVVSVADQGQGISEEDLPHLFEEFFRTSQARQTQVEGTGLGLSIVQTIIQTHGGRIEVSSEVGKGTTFTLHLPVTDGAGGTE